MREGKITKLTFQLTEMQGKKELREMNILTIMHSKAFLVSFSHVKKTKKNRAIMTLPTYRQRSSEKILFLRPLSNFQSI